MKKLQLLGIFLLTATLFTACASNDTASSDATLESVVEESVEATPTPEPVEEKPASAKNMIMQGNPSTIYFADIAEASGDTFNAWIKVSTQFDPELSVYSYDTMPAGTTAIIVDFTINDPEIEDATVYWAYSLKTASESFSVWDGTSPADTLTLEGSGTYRLVFDAEKALGAPIETIESFQFVVPCLTDTCDTSITLKNATCITDASDLQYFETGKIE